MNISSFPNCCTSLILSNIPDFLPKKVDPLSISSDKGVFYLLDEEYANNHYCNIHAILTDEQVYDGVDVCLKELGFVLVNSSEKHEDGGEWDTGNLNTYVADWQNFRNKLCARLDFKKVAQTRPDWNEGTDNLYMPRRIKQNLPLYKAAYLNLKQINSGRAWKVLVESILEIGIPDLFSLTLYELLFHSDCWRKQDIKSFWDKPLSGKKFYMKLAQNVSSQDYRTACNVLIDRYKIDLPRF